MDDRAGRGRDLPGPFLLRAAVFVVVPVIFGPEPPPGGSRRTGGSRRPRRSRRSRSNRGHRTCGCDMHRRD